MEQQPKTKPEFWQRKISDDFNYNATDFNTWYLNQWKVVEAA